MFLKMNKILTLILFSFSIFTFPSLSQEKKIILKFGHFAPINHPIERDKIFTGEKNYEMKLKAGGLDYFKKITESFKNLKTIDGKPIKEFFAGAAKNGVKLLELLGKIFGAFFKMADDKALGIFYDNLGKAVDILAEIDRKLPKTPPVQKTATIAGISKLSAIIDQFGESQKQAWLDSIALQNETVAKQLGWKSALQLREESKPVTPFESPSHPVAIAEPTAIESDSPSQSDMTPALSVGAITEDIFDESMIVPISRYRDVASMEKPVSELVVSANNYVAPKHEPTLGRARASEFDVLLDLSDTDLVTLLHSCDKSAILTALCGASNSMIQRIERLIPRNEVKRFRLHLRQLASTSTDASELAQSAILLRAEELVIASRISALSSVTFVSAA
jgi:hypothetical protein